MLPDSQGCELARVRKHEGDDLFVECQFSALAFTSVITRPVSLYIPHHNMQGRIDKED